MRPFGQVMILRLLAEPVCLIGVSDMISSETQLVVSMNLVTSYSSSTKLMLLPREFAQLRRPILPSESELCIISSEALLESDFCAWTSSNSWWLFFLAQGCNHWAIHLLHSLATLILELVNCRDVFPTKDSSVPVVSRPVSEIVINSKLSQLAFVFLWTDRSLARPIQLFTSRCLIRRGYISVESVVPDRGLAWARSLRNLLLIRDWISPCVESHLPVAVFCSTRPLLLLLLERSWVNLAMVVAGSRRARLSLMHSRAWTPLLVRAGWPWASIAVIKGLFLFSLVSIMTELIKALALMSWRIFSLNRKMSALRGGRSRAHSGKGIALVKHSVEVRLLRRRGVLLAKSTCLWVTVAGNREVIVALLVTVLESLRLGFSMIALLFAARVLWLLFGKMMRTLLVVLIASRHERVVVVLNSGLRVLWALLLETSLDTCLGKHCGILSRALLSLSFASGGLARH